MRSLLKIVSLSLFVMSSAFGSTHASAGVSLLSSMDAHTIDHNYIVAFKPEVTEAQIRAHNNYVFTTLLDVTNSSSNSMITHYYDSKVLKGYAGYFEPHVLETLKASPIIDFIERDQIVYANDIQEDSTWGLARISHRDHPEGSEQHTYHYPSSAGEGVSVYVVDTGININHVDFEGRAVWGKTIPQGDEDVDGNGHGTHCAGTIASKTYGVAKKAKVVAVKVLRSNGSGSMSDVIKGIEFVASDHQRRVTEATTPEAKKKVKSVANMSLGGGRSFALDRVVNAAVDQGVVFAVAAGNDARNACYYSPAAAKKAITVGASTIDDTNAWFSNHGKCVDVFAPGLDITSTWIGSDTATNTISGTSMASPHVAGLSALVLGYAEESMTPQQVKDYIIKTSSKNMLKFSGVSRKTKNRLIFANFSTSQSMKHVESTPVVQLTWEHHRAQRIAKSSAKVVSSKPASPKPIIRIVDNLVTVYHEPKHTKHTSPAQSPSTLPVRISSIFKTISERLSERRLKQLVFQV